MARVRIHAHALRGCETFASDWAASTSNGNDKGNGNGNGKMDSGIRRNERQASRDFGSAATHTPSGAAHPPIDAASGR